MCGIFGVVSPTPLGAEILTKLARHAQQRGRDSSGLIFLGDHGYEVRRADYPIMRLLHDIRLKPTLVAMGHSRLITNGLTDNQPVIRDGICVLHNGIVVNEAEVWSKLAGEKRLQVDTEAIAATACEHLEKGGTVASLSSAILAQCQGIVACAIAIPTLGKLCLFSNNGSLYAGDTNGIFVFASESYPLHKLGCSDVRQIRTGLVIDIPASQEDLVISDVVGGVRNLVPALGSDSSLERLLQFPQPTLVRCTKCILPETMPFIRFDEQGVCNYCHNYKPRNAPKPREELFRLVEPYRRKAGDDCIVPFSGGRDSCYALHLIVNELEMKPITYTYDWGMVTDLGRRNISRMSAAMGVENIIVAADIAAKRDHIAKNLRAWLKSPNLGMISILTAGDKHFFRHVETIKRQTGIDLNLWGVNPLEVTHFKSGFLGVPPDFEEKHVYSNGALKQLRYQALRLRAMIDSPGYFNDSLWDTLSGEYYRSFMKKQDYFHIFDYWTWEERAVDQCLAQYDWELAPDTSTTWRIGDGTAAFYNYIYYLVAGFTEHDTFRSNQIREGQITRAEALTLVKDENRPRYPNIKWYLDAVGMDFDDVIQTINQIPKLYKQ